MIEEGPQGEDIWIPGLLFPNDWAHICRSQGELWLKRGNLWEVQRGSNADDIEWAIEEYERNRIKYFLPHGQGKAFLNDWTNGIVMLVAPNRVGKEQPIDTFVQTPTGPRRLGQLAVGDEVFDMDGNVQHVTRITDNGVKPIWRIEFDHGEVATYAGSEHQWLYLRKHRGYLHKENRKHRNSTYGQWEQAKTSQLNVGGFIPMPSPIAYKSTQLYMDPYVLGVLLGDGSLSARGDVRLTSADPDLVSEVSRRLPNSDEIRANRKAYGYYIVRRGGTPRGSNGQFLRNRSSTSCSIHKLGLAGHQSYTKFIPEEYLRSDVESRTWLLRGLMDTDGCVAKTGKSNAEFSTTSHQLAQDVRLLVLSLGGKVNISTRMGRYVKNGRTFDTVTNFRVHVRLPNINPFFIKRKADRYNQKSIPRANGRRIITAIVPAGTSQCRCIEVSGPTRTYLADDFVVTHNSAHGTAFSLLRVLPCRPDWLLFNKHGIAYHEYRGPRKLVISSYSWGNVEEVWEEYRKWTPREFLGPFSPAWGKYKGEKGPPKNLSFSSGKSQRLKLTGDAQGVEYIFLCDTQSQSAWEGKRWDDGHFDEQREKEKWIGYLRGTANTKGLVQAAFTLTGHVLPERPDTGAAGWIHNELWNGEYDYGKTIGRYKISMDDVPDSVLGRDRKDEMKRQWVDEPTKNQDEEMIRKGRARYHGEWEAGGGLVVDSFDPHTHVIPDIDMTDEVCVDATKYRAIDHGLSRPCGCLLGAAFPWGDLLIYKEYYEKGRTVPFHARKIVEMCGNKMEEFGVYTDESIVAPIATFEEIVTGTEFAASVLDGRSFNSPSHERAVTLGQLYNDCGLNCSPASTKHNRTIDAREGVLPNMLRFFTKQVDRPHLYWQLWKRKVISDDAYQAWLKQRHGDWKNGAQIYFVRSLRWTFDELRKWAIDPVTGLPEGKNDHLMACLRYMTAENPTYQGNRWKEDPIDREEKPKDNIGSRRFVGY